MKMPVRLMSELDEVEATVERDPDVVNNIETEEEKDQNDGKKRMSQLQDLIILGSSKARQHEHLLHQMPTDENYQSINNSTIELTVRYKPFVSNVSSNPNSGQLTQLKPL